MPGVVVREVAGLGSVALSRRNPLALPYPRYENAKVPFMNNNEYL